MIQRARTLAQAGLSPAEILRVISRETGRSSETVRMTIRRYDRQHPETAVLASRHVPARQEADEELYAHYRRGESVSALAFRYGRTQSSVNRAIRRIGAQRIADLPLAYVPNPEFGRPGAEKEILGPAPEPEHAPRKPRVPAGIPAYLASLYEVPLLTPGQEKHQFRRFNYLKYRAVQLREELDPQRPNRRRMDEIERLYEEIVAAKNELVRANLRLVVAIAKRYLGSQEQFFDLVSDGNMSLMRAVEKFDYALGNKFSTYASWAIKKNYARAFASQMQYCDRFRTSLDEVLCQKPEYRADPYEREMAQALRVRAVGRLLGCLDEREREIISHRFGLETDGRPQTLQEVGDRFGLTKERIRQLETRAMGKLRRAAQQAGIECPAA